MVRHVPKDGTHSPRVDPRPYLDLMIDMAPNNSETSLLTQINTCVDESERGLVLLPSTEQRPEGDTSSFDSTSKAHSQSDSMTSSTDCALTRYDEHSTTALRSGGGDTVAAVGDSGDDTVCAVIPEEAAAAEDSEATLRRRILATGGGGSRISRKAVACLPQVRAQSKPIGSSSTASWRSAAAKSTSGVSADSKKSKDNKKSKEDAKYVFEGVHVKALGRNNARSSRTKLSTDSTAGSQTGTHTTATSHSGTPLSNLMLPNGQETSVSDLLRQLLRGTTHHCVNHDSHSYYYFRGWEGIELWEILFFPNQNTDEAQVVSFGNMLIEQGLVHNYTPSAQDFKAAFLVLQPLQEPRAMNTHIKWPTWDKTSFEDPTAVVLRLSLLLDKACQLQGSLDDNLLFRNFQDAVSQLQVMDFPSHPVERKAFTLNLYNMGVRQAALVAKLHDRMWPIELKHLVPFLSSVGYRIGGVWYSLADIQALIYGRVGESNQNLVSRHSGFMRKAMCLGSATDDEYYKSTMVRGDKRVLFATSYGAASSPAVATIFPHKIEETLQAAAEAYCRTNILVVSNQIVIPRLIAWHRHDFGGNDEQVLDNLLPYMSLVQVRHVQFLRANGTLYVAYDHDFHRAPDVRTNPCQWPKFVRKVESSQDIHVELSENDDMMLPGENEDQFDERMMERSDAGATFFSCDMSEVTMDTHFKSIASIVTTRSTRVLGPKKERRLEV